MVCQKCGNKQFRKDIDGDSHCLTCGQIWREKPVEVDYEKERKKREADYSTLTAQQRADRRYRESELFKQTRKKHQKRYRESEKGKQAKKDYIEKNRILERLVNRLQELGWVN